MLKPINKAIYVKPDAPLEKKGALYLPPSDIAQHCGIVQQTDSAICKAGDLIAFTRFFPTTVRGVDLVVVDEKSIIGVDDAPLALDGEGDQGVSKQAVPLIVPGGRPPISIN